MNIIDKPLSNLQVELLQIFSLNLPEDELIEVRRLLTRHFAEKASNEMDRLWDLNNWSNDTMDGWLKGAE